MFKKLMTGLMVMVFAATIFAIPAGAMSETPFRSGALIIDDKPLTFGNSKDFKWIYDETTDNRLELSDGTNLFMGITDAGTTATFEFYGSLGIGVVPDVQVHINAAAGAYLRLSRDDVTVSQGQILGKIEFETLDTDSPGVGAIIYGMGGGATGEGMLTFYTGLGGSATEALRIDSSQNMGLGVTPEAWAAGASIFQIGGGGIFRADTDTADNYLAVQVNGYYDGAWKHINAGYAARLNLSAGNGAVTFASAATGVADSALTWTTTLIIDASANMGLGVTPQAWKNTYTALQIGGNAAIMSRTAAGAGADVYFMQNAVYDTDDSFEYISTDEASMYGQSGGAHTFTVATSGTAGNNISWTTALTIENDGDLFIASGNKLGVGRTPAAGIDNYVTSGPVRYLVDSDSIASAESANFSAIATGNAVTRTALLGVIYYDQSGQAGSNGPAAFLDLEPGDGTDNYLWVDNTNDLRISTTVGHIGAGNLGTVVGDQSSDERTKEKIKPISYGLNEILALEPLEFEQFGVHKLGFGAQRTRLILPEVVYDTGVKEFKTSKKEDGKWKKTKDEEDSQLKMQYVQIIPVLVQAMQEQQIMIDMLWDALCEEHPENELCGE